MNDTCWDWRKCVSFKYYSEPWSHLDDLSAWWQKPAECLSVSSLFVMKKRLHQIMPFSYCPFMPIYSMMHLWLVFSKGPFFFKIFFKAVIGLFMARKKVISYNFDMSISVKAHTRPKLIIFSEQLSKIESNSDVPYFQTLRTHLKKCWR